MSTHFDSTDAPRGLAASSSTGYLSRLPSPVLLPIVSSLEANPDFSWLEQPSPAGPTKSMLMAGRLWLPARARQENLEDGHVGTCLLYTSDAADDLLCVDLGGRRI